MSGCRILMDMFKGGLMKQQQQLRRHRVCRSSGDGELFQQVNVVATPLSWYLSLSEP
ncbi:hypothetical protein HanIR_Chr14g0700981 [Helianthus annuus]|nr:hypothetical protein HanIR_Chr14g0700981 [Helianthus annuus]